MQTKSLKLESTFASLEKIVAAQRGHLEWRVDLASDADASWRADVARAIRYDSENAAEQKRRRMFRADDAYREVNKLVSQIGEALLRAGVEADVTERWEHGREDVVVSVRVRA